MVGWEKKRRGRWERKRESERARDVDRYWIYIYIFINTIILQCNLKMFQSSDEANELVFLYQLWEWERHSTVIYSVVNYCSKTPAINNY